MADKSRERALEGALFRLYEQWRDVLGYRAERFRQTIVPGCQRYKGGIAAVRGVLLKPGTGGFQFLRKANRLDLTVENLVLHPHWADLFDDTDRKLAKQKIKSKQPTTGGSLKKISHESEKGPLPGRGQFRS